MQKLLVYFLLLSPFCSLGAIAELFKVNSAADNIEDFDTKFILRPYLEINTLFFQIKDQDNAQTPVTLLPNISLINPGVAFSYEWIGGSFVYNIPGTSLDKDKYGTTRYFDLQFNWNFRHFGGDLIYQDYKGFYLLDASAHGETQNLRPDMTARIATVNTYFVFNRHFSPSAAFKQSERQINSAGSTILTLSARTYSLSNSSAIIPAARQAVFAEAGTISVGNFVDFTFGPGYGHTKNFGPWALTAMLTAGLGLQNQQYHTATNFHNRYNVALSGNLKWAAVYRDDKFFAGSQFALDASQTSFAKGQFLLISSSIHFFGGWRF